MIQFWIPPPVGKLRWPSRFWQWAEIELLGLRLLPNGNHVYRGVWWHILCHRYWAWFSSSLLTSGPCKYLNMYCLDDHWCNVVFDHLSGLLKRETCIVSYRYMTPCNEPRFWGFTYRWHHVAVWQNKKCLFVWAVKRETCIVTYWYMTPCNKTNPGFEGLLIGGIMLLCDKKRNVCLPGSFKTFVLIIYYWNSWLISIIHHSSSRW